MSTLQRALEIAVSAHSGVLDRGGELYILHPLRLVLKAKTEQEKILAALHDVVEDCDDWTLDRLREEGFSSRIVELLDNLTRRENEPYEEFIERCCGSIATVKVKLLDIEDNMDAKRLPTMKQKDFERLKKYHKARERLLDALGWFGL